MTVYVFMKKLLNKTYQFTVGRMVKRSFASCGKNVTVPAHCSFVGSENIYVGDDVSFSRTTILSTRANVRLGSHIMFGPYVTIITGDHRTDIIGRYMKSVKDSEKLPENDQDVIIHDDVWIGANATILKGVEIGEGSVIAAGSLVIHDIAPYSVAAGIPAKIIKKRFDDITIAEHRRILRGGVIQTCLAYAA